MILVSSFLPIICYYQLYFSDQGANMPVYFAAIKQALDGKNKLSKAIPEIVKEFRADQPNVFSNLTSNVADIVVDFDNIAVLLEV